MECHDDDVDDEMMSGGDGRRGNVVCGRIFCILEYGMAVGSSKILYGSLFLFFVFPFSRIRDRR